MIRTYKFRMDPTAKQEASLVAMLDDFRFLYNAALEDRKYMWERHRINVTVRTQDAQLKEIRADNPDYERWSAAAESQTVLRLDKAFQAFFRRIKAGAKRVGYPRYKAATRFNTAVHRAVTGAKWDSAPHLTQTRAYFKGVGHVKVKQHRHVVGLVKTLTIKREGRRWYVILAAEQELQAPLPKTGATIGIDLATGHNGLAYTSQGERIGNPAYRKASPGKLAEVQQALSRTKQRSNRHRKARERVSGVYRKISNQRRDYLHKVSRQLVDSYDVIVAEELNIAGMTRRAVPRPDGAGGYQPNGGNAKKGLNRSILDAGWGILLEFIRAKAESAGRQFIQVNPAYTSQTCSECGHREAANRNGKEFLCLSCGHRADADKNAAVNILRAGLVLREAAQAA
ncbi:transposase [Pseudarthrobacter sulfonivorans]|uniref:RNA-guided endonuclease InsQ/TnpB family protein n=1 Tax=Pseudarthrobacter sulfonivorans TaxID=121292 RepID=UPI002856E989|nr:transposase [Pseudarthrobacter sulfonivorans]MDR6413487.1 putative transposase [Pseudarthrobacter sulfonivorans]